ncbi:MAG: hypothetical protein IPG04_07615 [Polyangiaceae bacterium]|nr:hypothetical protein [Polyangiaceae bacterium]
MARSERSASKPSAGGRCLPRAASTLESSTPSSDSSSPKPFRVTAFSPFATSPRSRAALASSESFPPSSGSASAFTVTSRAPSTAPFAQIVSLSLGIFTSPAASSVLMGRPAALSFARATPTSPSSATLRSSVLDDRSKVPLADTCWSSASTSRRVIAIFEPSMPRSASISSRVTPRTTSPLAFSEPVVLIPTASRPWPRVESVSDASLTGGTVTPVDNSSVVSTSVSSSWRSCLGLSLSARSSFAVSFALPPFVRTASSIVGAVAVPVRCASRSRSLFKTGLPRSELSWVASILSPTTSAACSPDKDPSARCPRTWTDARDSAPSASLSSDRPRSSPPSSNAMPSQATGKDVSIFPGTARATSAVSGSSFAVPLPPTSSTFRPVLRLERPSLSPPWLSGFVTCSPSERGASTRLTSFVDGVAVACPSRARSESEMRVPSGLSTSRSMFSSVSLRTTICFSNGFLGSAGSGCGLTRRFRFDEPSASFTSVT